MCLSLALCGPGGLQAVCPEAEACPLTFVLPGGLRSSLEVRQAENALYFGVLVLCMSFMFLLLIIMCSYFYVIG